MKGLPNWVLALVLAAGLGIRADAHDPPGTTFFIWQWSDSNLPVLDGDLSEWEVIPEFYWFTISDLKDSIEKDAGQPDPSDYDVRFVLAWNESQNRLYLAWKSTDDYWNPQRDYLELSVDADHSGGPFGSLEGESDEQAQTQLNYHAQSIRLYLSEQEELAGVPSWNWLTQADRHWVLPYSEGYFQWSKIKPGKAYSWTMELSHIWWDDFSTEDPAMSTPHDFEEGEIIGLSIRNKDGDGGLCCGQETDEVLSDWGLSFGDSRGNADFFSDWMLMPVDPFGEPTPVENNTWGNIKASLRFHNRPNEKQR